MLLPAALLCLAAMLVVQRTPVLGKGSSETRLADGPRYTVVETEGHNLLVTDNGTNTLYFYTVDKDKPVGSTLKMRAKLDLNDVGKPEMTPVPVNVQK